MSGGVVHLGTGGSPKRNSIDALIFGSQRKDRGIVKSIVAVIFGSQHIGKGIGKTIGKTKGKTIGNPGQ